MWFRNLVVPSLEIYGAKPKNRVVMFDFPQHGEKVGLLGPELLRPLFFG